MNTISIQHLTKTYGAFAAVSDLSLDIPAGTVFGLLGPNGAGKTTTFKCALGMARPTTGTVLFNGKPLVPAAFETIAYVPERNVLYDWMTIAEHVQMTRHAFKAFDVARCKELLALFSLNEKQRVRSLSKGMKTATAIALTFARRAETLILDEPTSGLDPVNQREVLNLIINEAANGTSIIFSSHQIGHVERAAERIAILQRGRLILEGSVDDLKADRKIVDGILPSEDSPLTAFNTDARIARVDRNGRILRLQVTADADGVAAALSAAGAQGVRVLDLNLEDIFINAVSPANSTADVVEA
ncbi:MAG TPA: ABC transporter ATP-binding protein [Verrucomicrobiae bacterium]|jgi:ABC-2 type transport system ATP-binding protein|nr:ABC transporter ATP-binding protein [Verrucomicrobiae bacterium]